MSVKQLDLFNYDSFVPAAIAPPGPPVLNGFYYERSSKSFVSFVLGRRHYVEPASGCRLDRVWQEKTKRERSI